VSTLRVISLGAGVQSTTMALMAAHGEIGPMPDAAIFADTGDEPGPVYDQVKWLIETLPFPVHVARKSEERLGDAQMTDSEARVPWHKDGGMLQRQCTRNWKIDVLRRKIRDVLGTGPRSYIAPNSVEAWIGISTDEAYRVSPSRIRFIVNRHPLIEKRLNRGDGKAWLDRKGYPIPPKSSCVFCPYRRDDQWRDLKQNDPAGWARACEVDEALRSPAGIAKFKVKTFAHRSLLPLALAPIESNEGQLNLFLNECEGMCGV
jgi:hypothetical protein